MAETNQNKIIVQGLLGAAVGGAIGYFAFFWLTRHGLYALVLPGGLLGIGAGALARGRSVPLAVICGVAALALGLFTEWRFAPFVADKSLGYFATHIFSLQPYTLIMVAVGTVVGGLAVLGGKRKNSPETQ